MKQQQRLAVRRMWMSIGRMRQLSFYKPIAVLLAILVSPLPSWFEGPNSPSPFKAQAQTTTYCDTTLSSNVNCIFDVRANGAIRELVQLEKESVDAYLLTHGLPLSEGPKVYQFGRQDLRSAVRAVIYTKMLNIIMTPAANRSTYEARLYRWLQESVQANEILLGEKTLQHFNQFKINPCAFRTDADIAKVYEFNWDPAPFCYPIGTSALFAPYTPNANYFKAYGLKYSFQRAATEHPDYGSMFVDTSISLGAQWGLSLATGSVAAAIFAAALGANFTAALAASSAAVGTFTALTAGSGQYGAFAISASSISASSGSAAGIALLAGPVIVVFVAFVVAGVAIFSLINDQEQQKEIDKVSADLAFFRANLPDLTTYSDTLGAQKLMHTLYRFTMPDHPSSAPLPSHQTTDRNFVVENTTSLTSFITTPTLTFRDWNNNQWSLTTAGNWLAGTCTSSSTPSTCVTPTSFNASFRYLDATGAKWTAVPLADHNILSTKQDPKTGVDQLCPVSSALSVSTATDLSKCISYVSKKIVMKAPNNTNQTVSLTPFFAPLITNPSLNLFFSRGVASTQNITVNASPAATICVTGLPLNFNAPTAVGSCVNGNSFPITYNGALSPLTSLYSIQVSIGNGIGAQNAGFFLFVRDDLNIISSPEVRGTAGKPFSFTVQAVGNPTPRLTLDPTGYTLDGLTFRDNGDGTGTLSGIYTGVFSESTCILGACGGFIATNSSGSVKQNFRLLMSFSPDAIRVGPTELTVFPGQTQSVYFSSTGASTAVSWVFRPLANAPWITFRDLGDGTALLTAAPPAGTTPGLFEPLVAPKASGSGILTLYSFPVTVSSKPGIINWTPPNFTVGTTGSSSINASSGAVNTGVTLPDGLYFSSGNPAQITGTPAPGTGGDFTVPLTASSPDGSTNNSLLLRINERPAITSPNLAVVYTGQPTALTVATNGYPRQSSSVLPSNAAAPTNPANGEGMSITATGLPPGLTASDRNLGAIRTGTLIIAGTPTTPGTYRVPITANNAVVAPARQTLNLVVLPAVSPSAPATNVLGLWSLSRDSNNNILVDLVLTNNGRSTISNLAIGSIRLGNSTGAFAPAGAASIASSGTAAFRVSIPGTGLLAGTANVINITGNHSGGSFNTAGRVVIP